MGLGRLEVSDLFLSVQIVEGFCQSVAQDLEGSVDLGDFVGFFGGF